jgi:hypothetical protein
MKSMIVGTLADGQASIAAGRPAPPRHAEPVSAFSSRHPAPTPAVPAVEAATVAPTFTFDRPFRVDPAKVARPAANQASMALDPLEAMLPDLSALSPAHPNAGRRHQDAGSPSLPPPSFDEAGRGGVACVRTDQTTLFRPSPFRSFEILHPDGQARTLPHRRLHRPPRDGAPGAPPARRRGRRPRRRWG